MKRLRFLVSMRWTLALKAASDDDDEEDIIEKKAVPRAKHKT